MFDEQIVCLLWWLNACLTSENRNVSQAMLVRLVGALMFQNSGVDFTAERLAMDS